MNGEGNVGGGVGRTVCWDLTLLFACSGLLGPRGVAVSIQYIKIRSKVRSIDARGQ